MMLHRIFDQIERLSAPLVRPLSSRLNPIMIKEVRQALRGNYFQWSFWVVTLVATIAGSMLLFNFSRYSDSRGGMEFFITIFAILSAAVNVLVPFQAFLSVGAEWDENTYDLLVLSELTPMQIAKGKLFSAVVQALLFYAAFTPFLVFAFLLRGLDLGSAGWALGVCMVYSVTLSTLAICLSSLVTQKFARVLLMALLVALLVMGCVGSVGLAYMVLEERLVQDDEFLMGTGAMLSLGAVLGLFLLLLSAARFTHPEENRSTGLRIMSTLMTLLAAGWMCLFYWNYRDPDVLHAMCTLSFTGVTLLGVIFCAEPETLGRRVALEVPRQRLLAFLAAPFLPGGGRGVLHYFLNIGIVLGVAIGSVAVFGTGTSVFGGVGSFFSARSYSISMGMLPYLACYLLLPTLLFSRFSSRLRSRVLTRISVPVFVLASIFVPTIVLFLFTGRGDSIEHFGNPITTIDDSMASSYGDLWYAAWAAISIGLFNLPRIVRSFRELESLRLRRLAREASSGRLGQSSQGGGAPGSDAFAQS